MNSLKEIGTPLQAPIPKGDNVSESLLKVLKKIDTGFAASVIKERCEYGLKKYGQSLMSKDGRNSIIDALQEAGDLMQYIHKAQMNNEDLTDVKYIVGVIVKLLYFDQ
jgi:hypothetical protein